jgi:hypothetical protein
MLVHSINLPNLEKRTQKNAPEDYGIIILRASRLLKRLENHDFELMAARADERRPGFPQSLTAGAFEAFRSGAAFGRGVIGARNRKVGIAAPDNACGFQPGAGTVACDFWFQSG